MRSHLAAAAAAGLLFSTAQAIFADEAWTVDYHLALLGEPQPDTTFFHQPNPASKASLIYTFSERGVLGAVNPKDGSLVWRHNLGTDGWRNKNKFLRAGEGEDVVVSGLGNTTAAWNAADGRLVWDLNSKGPIEDVEILELEDSASTGSNKDVVVMASGDAHAVLRVDGNSGVTKWEYKLDGTDIAYQVSTSSTGIYAIVLHKTLLGNIKIKVITLDSTTGRKLDEYSLSSDSEVATSHSILAVGANSASPIIAWTDASHSVVKINIIGTKGVSSFPLEKTGDTPVHSIKLHAPIRSNALAHFLVHYETTDAHWADVFHIDLKRNKVEKAYTLPKISGQGAFSTSTVNANVYFTRVTRDRALTVSSASDAVLAKWSIESFGVQAGPFEVVHPVHAVTEASIRGDAVSAIRTALLLSTGDWILLRDGTTQWQRPEALAGTLSAVFAQPAAIQTLAENLEKESHSNFVAAYIHRVLRHLGGIQTLPAVLQTLPQKIIDALLGTTADDAIVNDVFGFNQIIACATQNGRVIALDSGRPGTMLWNVPVASPQMLTRSSPSLLSPEPGVLSFDLGDSSFVIGLNSSNGEFLSEGSYGAQLQHGYSGSLAKKYKLQYKLTKGVLQAKLDSTLMWSFVPSSGQRILSVIPRPLEDPVASIGKVLGDRRVLYKYLSPNTALVVTAGSAQHSASVYILDTVSGSVIYSNTHQSVDLTKPIPAVMSENWFAYSYTSVATEDLPKGHQLVSGELFESLVPNDRGPLSSSSNASSITSSVEPYTLLQTFQIPEPISKLAVTRTKQGITTRQLLAVLPDSDSVVGIPLAAIDTRRTVGRAPTKDEQMEGLSQYGPVIEFDPQWTLNHRREVLDIQGLVTSPASIESTSLVFAYGLDIFGTRLSPSFSFDILGKDFNKVQMLATVFALAAITLLVAPLVMRKQIDARWQFA